jgi:hypothetical protein
MKNTTRMTLRSALFTVLLSSSTMLAAADGGGETPGPAVTPPSPGPIDQRAQAKPPGGPMILGDTQLDEIKAGQIAVCLPPLLGAEICLEL